jgi:GNAT superfamily N-acetyltransferase
VSQPVAGFKIRKATSKDMDVLVEHRQKMFDEVSIKKPDPGDVSADPYRAWAREMMKKRIYHGYIVSTEDGKVAASGCVWLRQVQPSRGRSASMVPYLISMYTAPKFRRKGLASMIVKQAMAWAKKNGYGTMTLHASLAGRKVYAKLGWKRTWEMEVRLG